LVMWMAAAPACVLQHPLDVEYSPGRVYVADTYNHKIKVIDLQNNRIETFAGNGRGNKDGEARAAPVLRTGRTELAGNKLFVADYQQPCNSRHRRGHKARLDITVEKRAATLPGGTVALRCEP
jgi:DNA-binding beta-propeller fold protein YncE